MDGVMTSRVGSDALRSKEGDQTGCGSAAAGGEDGHVTGERRGRGRSGAVSRLTRRDALRWAALAGGAAAGSTLIPSAAWAAPAVANPVTTVNFQINWQQGWGQEASRLCQQYTDQAFNSAHRGVRAVPQPWGNASGVLAQVLAGDPSAPAVVSSCCGDFAVALPMLARLDPWLGQSNLSRGLWSQGQLLTYQEPSGLYGVPAYTACQPLIYSQTLFDDLGLAYPDPAWDYKEAESTWRSLAGKNPQGQWRYGTTMQWYPTSFDGQAYLLKGWGGELMDPTHTRCLIDSSQCIAAGNYIYSMIWDKVIINRFGIPNHNGASALGAGLVGMYQSAGNMLFEAVAELGTRVKWDVLPMPAWPVQRGTNVNVDYYAMNAQYRNQELAWELFQFVAAAQGTNRFLIRTTLSFPNLISMWDEWEALVRSAAPVTRTKALHWWADAARQGYGYGHEFWKYDDPQAEAIQGQVAGEIWNRQLDVTAGFTSMATQVNALEGAAGAASAEAAAIARGLRAGASGRYPAPVVTAGVGTAPVTAGALVQAHGTSVSLTGTGAGVGTSADGLVWAGAAETAVDAEFTCRLDALQNVNCPHLSQWAAAGLMARNDLSDEAPVVLVALTAGNGVMVTSRAAAMQAPVQQLGAKGLPAASGLTAYPPRGTASVLKAPLWLRLSRKATTWTAHTSTDGRTWAQAGAPVKLQMAGCWVGPFATANDASFGGHGQMRAAFSGLSMPVAKAMRIGAL